MDTPLATRQRLTVVFVSAGSGKCLALVYPLPRAEFIGRVMTDDKLPDPIEEKQVPEDLLKLLRDDHKGFLTVALQKLARQNYDALQADKLDDGKIYFH